MISNWRPHCMFQEGEKKSNKSPNQALPHLSFPVRCMKKTLSVCAERRVNTGPGSAAQTPLLQESAPALQVRVKLITTILFKQCSHWHDNFSQNAILISTQHTKITGRGGWKKKKQFRKIPCLCNSLNAIFYCCFFPTKSLGTHQWYINVAV